MQKTEVLQIRLTKEDKERIKRHASALGVSMSDFIRDTCSARAPVQTVIDVFLQDEPAKEKTDDEREGS